MGRCSRRVHAPPTVLRIACQPGGRSATSRTVGSRLTISSNATSLASAIKTAELPMNCQPWSSSSCDTSSIGSVPSKTCRIVNVAQLRGWSNGQVSVWLDFTMRAAIGRIGRTLCMLVGANEIVARDASLIQSRPQRGTFDCSVTRQRHWGNGAVWFSSRERDVIAAADNFKSEYLQGAENSIVGRIDGKLGHGG
jgi:hypothetical protein